MSDIVQELRGLLGHDVVLLGWPRACKGANRRWRHLSVASMTPQYLAKLGNGNIGVALGEKSGGLCCLDVDLDEFVEPFLAANPDFHRTLQTHGARGRVFWFRCKGDYPRRTKKLRTCSGEDAGEFRSNGSQSIIAGIHPDTRRPYQIVQRAAPAQINFAAIVWPEGLASLAEDATAQPDATHSPNGKGCTEETEDTEETEAPEDTEVIPVGRSGGMVFSVLTLEDALRVSLPDHPHDNNHLLFQYARAVKALEAQHGKYSPQQLRDAFDQWYAKADRRFLRPEQSKEDYMLEFLNAYGRAKYPLGSVIVPKAWELAKEQPLPPTAMQFESPQLRLLVALCRQLQILVGEKPFYLTSRDCARLFGLKSHSTAAKWLCSLCVLKILDEVEKGNAKRATRYRYLSSVE